MKNRKSLSSEAKDHENKKKTKSMSKLEIISTIVQDIRTRFGIYKSKRPVNIATIDKTSNLEKVDT